MPTSGGAPAAHAASERHQSVISELSLSDSDVLRSVSNCQRCCGSSGCSCRQLSRVPTSKSASTFTSMATKRPLSTSLLASVSATLSDSESDAALSQHSWNSESLPSPAYEPLEVGGDLGARAHPPSDSVGATASAAATSRTPRGKQAPNYVFWQACCLCDWPTIYQSHLGLSDHVTLHHGC